MAKEKVKADEHVEEESADGSSVILIEKNMFLFGEINGQSTGSFIAGFKEVDSKPGVITINICSSGGWVEGGLCMYDLIKSSNNKVITVACGAVYSAAVLPFEAGDYRLMYKSARMLLHDMSISLGEIKLNAMENVTNETRALYDISCQYMAKCSGLSTKKINELCLTDTFLNATQAVKLGLADKVIRDNHNKFYIKG